MHMNKISKIAYRLAIFLFLYLPILVLIIYSFNDSAFSLLWQGFTFRWYESLMQNTELQILALHSLLVGFLAATGATGIGTLAAVTLYRYQFFGKK